MNVCRKVVSSCDVWNIFGNMPQLLMIHSKFLRKLKANYATLTVGLNFADIFRDFDFIPFYEKYIDLHAKSFVNKANLEKQYPDLKIAIEVH